MTQGASGKITLLRVNDTSGWGPIEDHIDVDVVVKLDTEPDKAFGFQLRGDSLLPARFGMLALLRDAFNKDLRVNIDYYNLEQGHKNGILCRVWIEK